METNKEKGDKYEIQSRDHIINVNNKHAYLWHHTPETLLKTVLLVAITIIDLHVVDELDYLHLRLDYLHLIIQWI